MTKPEKEKITDAESIPETSVSLLQNQEDVEATVFPLPERVDALMPELDELVKKNPNRLIGCGG